MARAARCALRGARALRQVARVIEEEWSYIPVGGPLPVAGQPVTAFGAAANLIHPATGYSIARRRAGPPERARLPGTAGPPARCTPRVKQAPERA
jgi:hypothetical protein